MALELATINSVMVLAPALLTIRSASQSVLKLSPEHVERGFYALPGIAALVDNDAVVFASNRSSWLYQTLWSLSAEDAKRLEESKKLGGAGASTIGLERVDSLSERRIYFS